MLRISIASVLALTLAACSGADPQPVATGSASQAVTVASAKGDDEGEGEGREHRALISFGDSLSDVGSYDVGTIKALGGGKYTVNSPTAQNWTQVLASYLDLPAPCAAETGLDGSAAYGFSVPVTTFPACTNYAQGGARVTNPVGPGNALLGGSNAILGLLTVPVVTQIQNHLAKTGGKFGRHDLVTVLAGANDVFINLGEVGAGALTPTQAVTAMGQAGGELAAYVKGAILANGAKHVVVLTVPDINTTPFGQSQAAATQQLITAMVTTFNGVLQQGLAGSGALIVDGYKLSQEESTHPEWFGITNLTTPACNLSPSVNPIGSSLACSTATTVPGAQPTWAFADGVHPTPYVYGIIADDVFANLFKAGWLF